MIKFLLHTDLIIFYINPKGEQKMKLSSPKKGTWTAALIIGVLGILGNFVAIPVVSQFSFWLVVIGFVLLVLGTYLKGL